MQTTPTSETHPPQQPADAFSFLRTDHRAIEGLFKGYLASVDADAKTHIAQSICIQLTAHAMAEEELVYPALRRLVDADAVDEATVGHHAFKLLVHDLSTSPPEDPLRDAKVAVLFELVRHHVEEEENELLSRTGDVGELDLVALGADVAARREAAVDELQRKGPPVPPSHPKIAARDEDAPAH